MVAAIASAALFILVVFYLAIVIFEIAAWWQIFTKANQPGWGTIIPIYNVYLMCKISGRPGWWVVLYLVPIVNIAISLIVAIDLAKSFSPGLGLRCRLVDPGLHLRADPRIRVVDVRGSGRWCLTSCPDDVLR